MTTDLEQPAQLVNLKTGEALTLQSPTEDLGRYLRDMRDLKRELQEVQNIVSRELVARMDDAVRTGAADGWTQHLPGGLKISAPSPEPTTEYDAGALHSALIALVDTGQIGIESVDRAIETTISYKVNRAALLKLVKASPEVAETVRQHMRFEHRERRIKIVTA